MLDTLYDFGTKLTQFFGESTLGNIGLSKQDRARKAEQFSGVPFSDLLPYEAFDSEQPLALADKRLRLSRWRRYAGRSVVQAYSPGHQRRFVAAKRWRGTSVALAGSDTGW